MLRSAAGFDGAEVTWRVSLRANCNYSAEEATTDSDRQLEALDRFYSYSSTPNEPVRAPTDKVERRSPGGRPSRSPGLNFNPLAYAQSLAGWGSPRKRT